MASGPQLLTVGHGTLGQTDFAGLLVQAGIDELVDVRTAPGSRRHPQVARSAMEQWLPEAGLGYRWARDLGGFRRARPDSPNVALVNPSFRGYADYMATRPFQSALVELVEQATRSKVVIMCAESLWWRCHRRLIADAVELGSGGSVEHLHHDGHLERHRLTTGVRRGPDGVPVYDVGVDRPLDL